MRSILPSLLFFAAAASGAQPTTRLSIDHIGLGTADLESAMKVVADRTGVRAVKGGVHPGRGTQNALMSLGNGTYLEIFAPVPGARLSAEDSELLKLAMPKPIFYAARTGNADDTAKLLHENGYATTPIEPGSRQRGDGSVLKWRRFSLTGAGLENAPFFIEWDKSSPHPSQTSPGGCSLARLEVLDSDKNVSALTKLFALLGLDVRAQTASAPGLRATLKCPKGEVVLGP